MGFHSKPCGLLNVNGILKSLESMLETGEKEDFLKKPNQEAIIRALRPGELIDLTCAAVMARLQYIGT